MHRYHRRLRQTLIRSLERQGGYKMSDDLPFDGDCPDENPPTAVATVETKAVTKAEDASVESLLRLAVQSNLDADKLEKLVELKHRMEDRAAAQEFASAMAEFQGECPPIPKDAQGQKLKGDQGVMKAVRFSSLEKIVEVTLPILTKYGLSFSWDSSLSAPNQLLCVCTLLHVNGHSRSARFECPTTSRAGMSDQQKVSSALTFARRQTLVQVLGLTSTDTDNDGADGADPTPLTEGHAADIEALISEVKADRVRFLKYMGVDEVEQIPESRFSEAVQALQRKRK